jgi:hypothetical protein
MGNAKHRLIPSILPIRSLGVGDGVFEKFICQLPPGLGGRIESPLIGNNFQLFALESGKIESLKLSFNTFINRQGSEVVMATDNPSQSEQLQEDFAKLSDLLQIQLAKT